VRLPFRGGCQCLFTHRVPTLVGVRGVLGARPRMPPDRVKWKAFASLRRPLSVDFCNDFKTREHDLERPILARSVEGRFRPSPTRSLPLPTPPFRATWHAMVLPLPREGEQRATLVPSAPSPDRARRARGGATTATALPDAACEAAPRIHRRLRRGWARQWLGCECGPSRSERRSSAALWAEAHEGGA